ncbi:hypothetical protein DENSPDRAFT_785738, partial [Dentipellis sp. KUC8613]
AIINACMIVMHPALYEAGFEVIRDLRGQPDFYPVIMEWVSIFNGIQVIVNRRTKPHIDGHTRSPWYDVVCSVGPYTAAIFGLRKLGVYLAYPPGTLIALCGSFVEHEVPDFDGERICYAFFMRDSIHELLRKKSPGWMYRTQYINLYCSPPTTVPT